MEFWNEALIVLNTIKYFSTNKQFVPPSVGNWSHTIQGIRYLWQKLKGPNLKFLCPRNLNQDPIENFFACIRSSAGRNINPTCAAFSASFKTLVLNNFTTPHSPGSNCQEDDGEALNTLKKFIHVDLDGVEPLEEVVEEFVEGIN